MWVAVALISTISCLTAIDAPGLKWNHHSEPIPKIIDYFVEIVLPTKASVIFIKGAIWTPTTT